MGVKNLCGKQIPLAKALTDAKLVADAADWLSYVEEG